MSRDEVDIRALRRVTSQIFDFIQNELKLDRVKLGRDFYWSVPHDALHDVGNPPKELVVGSLIDDLGFQPPQTRMATRRYLSHSFT